MKTATAKKRRIFTAIILLLLTAMLASLTACKTPVIDDTGHATVVVAVGEDVRSYDVPLDKIEGELGAIAILDYLKSKGSLDYVSVDAGYGPYLTKVGHLEENASAGIYVGIWTSVTSDQDRESTYSTTVTYEGEELVSAAVGLGQLSVTDGAVIYFGELKY